MKLSIAIVGVLLCAQSFANNNDSGYYVEALEPSRYITYQGRQLALYDSEGTDGPGILLVHGNTSASNSFRPVLDSNFGRQYKMTAVDLPGYGNSENAPSYNISYFVGAIAAAAVAAGADDGVLVGWSLGGDLILQAASSLPNAIGFFTFGTTPINGDPNLPAPFLTAQQSYAGAAVDFGLIGALTPLQITDYVNAFFRPDYGRIARPFYADGFRTDPNTRNAVFNAAIGADPSFQDEVAIAQGLTVPVAFVVGTEDAFINPDRLNAVAPTIPELYQNRIIYLGNTGHAIQYERPTLFNGLLRSFVRRAERASNLTIASPLAEAVLAH